MIRLPAASPAKHAPLRLLAAALLLSACLGPVWAGPVNLNAADAVTLAQELKGVGPVKAQRLVEYRQKHGPFRSVDELAQVKGFSQKLIDRNRADLRLGPGGPAAAGTTAGRPAPAAAARPAAAPAKPR